MEYCDKCHRDTDEPIHTVQTARATMSSPAEYEFWCERCLGPQYDADDVAYARAAARYDGEGRDWR